MNKYYEQDAGQSNGGGVTPPAPDPNAGGKSEETALTEDKVNELIRAAIEKGKKEAESEFETERAKLARERAVLGAVKTLTENGFVIAGEENQGLNDALAGMLIGTSEEDTKARLLALKKLIETKTQAEVETRLRNNRHTPPAPGGNAVRIGDQINLDIKKAIKK